MSNIKELAQHITRLSQSGIDELAKELANYGFTLTQTGTVHPDGGGGDGDNDADDGVGGLQDGPNDA